MWLWESELRELGFKRKSERYWRCERRFDLPDHAHLSVFSWGEQSIPAGRSGPARFLVELTEFHVHGACWCTITGDRTHSCGKKGEPGHLLSVAIWPCDSEKGAQGLTRQWFRPTE
jgi:hypothetical protein